MKKHIFIYGAGEAGASTIHSLKPLIEEIEIIGLIDDDLTKKGKTLNNIKIYSFDEFKKNIHFYSKVEVIISTEFITKQKKEELLDFCNSNKIIVKKIPEYKDWVNETEFNTSKIKKLQISDLLDRNEIILDYQNIQTQLSGKVILITGGAGSIGSQIVKSIIDFNPKHILIIDNNENRLHDLDLYINDLNKKTKTSIDLITLDINHKSSLNFLFKNFRPDIIFHAAAYKHVPMMEKNPLSAISNNILGTLNLLELTQKYISQKFIFISTDKAINPTNIMGATKRYSECLVQFFALKNSKTIYATTRFGNVLGSNGSVIPRFQNLIDNLKDIPITHPEIIRYFMTIEEACNLVLEASAMAKNREIFVFDMGKPCKIKDLAIKLIKLNGLQPGIDIKIKYTGLRPGEKLMEELLANSDNTIKTHHPKILKARSTINDFQIFYNKIKELKDSIKRNNQEKAVKILKHCLPEFISQNSNFSELDN